MNNKLQHKLYKYEVNPPENVWGRIAASLDDSHLSETFPVKLFNLEKTPPAGMWDKISSKLSIDNEAAIPITRKLSPFIRNAAAAIIIGIFAFTAIWFINSGKKNEQVVNSENNIINNIPTEKVTNEDSKPDITKAELQRVRDDAALEASKRTVAKLEISQRRSIMSENSDFYSTPVAISRNLINHNPEDTYRDIYYNSIHSDIHLEVDKYNIEDRYLMLMTPEGKIIRLAKKWGDLLCCVAGEEEGEDCIDQLKKWRNKIASAPLAPGNFLDILNLIYSLKENHP